MTEREHLMLSIVVIGERLDDLEGARIRFGNQVAAMEREIGTATPFLYEALAGAHDLEKRCEKELVRIWRDHPLAPWASEFHGLGEKSIARLIAIVGDPADRRKDQLRSYCGSGDPNRKKRAGMSQEEAFRLGNPRAKKQAWLISTSLLRAGHRDAYDARRALTTDKTHEETCVRCGPAGKPAQPGSPWSLAHQHADGLRLLRKWFLDELWDAAASVRVAVSA